MEKGRQQRKRHILGGSLSEVEVETLQEMARHHRHANFRRRALGVLALNEGRSGPAISGVLRTSVPQLYKQRFEYSPELNLIETLLKQAKYHRRLFATWAKQDLLQEVRALFGGFGTQFKFSYA